MATTYEASLVAVGYNAAGPPTLTEICGFEGKTTSMAITEELGLPGSTVLRTPVDKIEAVGKARLRDLTVGPCELWVRKTIAGTFTTTTALVSAGCVTGCHITDRTLEITAPGLLRYLGYWLADSNVLTALNAGVPIIDYLFSAVDQATIVQRICDAWQGLAYGNDGIVTTGLTATGVTRDLTLNSLEGKFVMPVVVEMGGRNNGFDLTVDPTTRALTMWSPRKGVDRTTSVFLDRRSIGTPDISWGVGPGSIGSEVFASSSSTGGSTKTSIQSNTALRATFGRSYITRSFQDISVQATLDDHAARALVDVGSQVFAASPSLLPVPGFAYGDFSTGDLITYDYDAGVGQQTFPFRVGKIVMDNSSGREMLAVGMV